MKMIVIGYSGSGKTVFTEELAKRFQCPVMHIDDLLFTGNFDSRDRTIAMKDVEDILRKNASWIMDGYKDTFTKREWLEAADYIVFLNFNRMTCFWRVLKRTCRRAARDVGFPGGRSNEGVSDMDVVDKKMASGKSADVESATVQSTGTIWQLSKIIRSFRWILLEERQLGGGKYYSGIGDIFPDKFIVLRTQKELDQFNRQISRSDS